MPLTWQDFGGGLQEAVGEDRTKLLGKTAKEGRLTGVRSGGLSRFAADAPSDPARRGSGVPGMGTPLPPWGGPNLPGLFTETSVATPVPFRGVPERGFKLDQPPDSLFTPTHAGHNSDPGKR